MSDAAVACIVSAALNAVLVIGTLWLRLRYGVEGKVKEAGAKAEARAKAVEEKLDTNTALTRTTGTAAVANAEAAAAAAASAAEQSREIRQELSTKLNGGVDDAIRKAIDPVRQVLAEHAEADERNVREVNDRLAAIEEYVHKRNHDMVDAMQSQLMKLEQLLQLAKAGERK